VNVPNLFMAGRDISVTDEALGTTRVMKTIGMMGEVVGKAAAVALKHNATPRDVYHLYWNELDTLLKLPGRARKGSDGNFEVRGDAPPPVDDTGGRSPAVSLTSLNGVVVDNQKAKLTGKWSSGASLEHVGPDYQYGRGAGVKAVFEFTVPKNGRYEVRFATAPHENRASNTTYTVRSADGEKTGTLNQRQPAAIAKQWVSLGEYRFTAGQTGAVEINAEKADGNVHIDAVNVVPVE
jgi:hypothetical protein